MKNIQEILQMKEQEIKRLEKEIGVLRAALSILNEADTTDELSSAIRATGPISSGYSPASRAPERVVNDPLPTPSPYPTFVRNADMIEQIRPEAMAADRPKRSFP